MSNSTLIETCTNPIPTDSTSEYLNSKVKPLFGKIIEDLIKFKPEDPNLYILKWAKNNSLSKPSTTSNLQSKESNQNLTLDRVYFHKSLIKLECEEYFNFYYSNVFKISCAFPRKIQLFRGKGIYVPHSLAHTLRSPPRVGWVKCRR